MICAWMIKQAFDANGIKFTFPTVHVAGEGEALTHVHHGQGPDTLVPAPF